MKLRILRASYSFQMGKKKKLFKALSLVLVFYFLSSTGSVWAAERPLKPGERDRIESVIGFLGFLFPYEAQNIENWLNKGWIVADDDLGYAGITDKSGKITISGKELIPFKGTETVVEKEKLDMSLACTLIHEKVHAHQAPNGDLIKEDPRREKKDWDASFDVFNECLGLMAIELEAYYREALFAYRNKWFYYITENLPPEWRKAMIEWCNKKGIEALQLLYDPPPDYEKAPAKRMKDKIEEIQDDPNLTEKQKIEKKIELLESAIDNLFKPGGAYPTVRAVYQIKRIVKIIEKIIDSIGGIIWADNIGCYFPPDSVENIITVEIYRFYPPPPPDPGLSLASPVYDFLPYMNFEKPVTITLPYYEWANPDLLDVYFFAPYAGKDVPLWEKITAGRTVDTVVHTISVETTHFTLFAVMESAPAPVGGIAFPADKLALLAPWIALAVIITIVTVSVTVYWRRR